MRNIQPYQQWETRDKFLPLFKVIQPNFHELNPTKADTTAKLVLRQLPLISYTSPECEYKDEHHE